RGKPQNPKFSLFWRGQATPADAHQFLNDLVLPDKSSIEGRIIDSFGVRTFSFVPNLMQSPEKTNVELAHAIIDRTNLPASLGLALSTTVSSDLPSSIYLWATITLPHEFLQATSEVGVTI